MSIISFFNKYSLTSSPKKISPISIKILTFLLAFSLSFNIVFAGSFKDLSSNHWAYEYIIYLTNEEVINGYTDNSFRPNGTVTNAEFIKLVVMSALPDWLDIKDAESSLSHWAGPYIWIAERYGVISSGSYNLSNLDKPITRIEMVRIITRADLLMKGNSLETSSKVKFNDVLALNNEDLLYLKHAYSKNLITGYENNLFKPYNNMTRAEAATMIYRFSK